jgi:hypothetical protein
VKLFISSIKRVKFNCWWYWEVVWSSWGGVFSEGLWIFEFSFHKLIFDFYVFVVICSIPFYSTLEFAPILSTIIPSEFSLTIFFSILPFSYILFSIRPSECLLTINSPIRPSYFLSTTHYKDLLLHTFHLI